MFLSSVLWNFTSTFTQAIKDVNNGTYGTHGYNLTLKNGGISLLKTKYIPAGVWAQIQPAKAGINQRQDQDPGDDDQGRCREAAQVGRSIRRPWRPTGATGGARTKDLS